MSLAVIAVSALALSSVYIAQKRSSKTAVVLTAVTGLLWVAGTFIFWISQITYPADEARREMAEWISVVPFAAALPMTFVSFVYYIIGSKGKEA